MEMAYGIIALLFFGAGALYIWMLVMTLRAQVATLRAQNAALAQQVQQRELQLRQFLAALKEPERKRLERELSRSHPMPNPPSGLKPTLERLATHTDDPYAIAMGWDITAGQPDIAYLSLRPSSPYYAGHILVTGITGQGKGTLIQELLLQLAMRASSSQIRFQLIDLKQIDAELWRGKGLLWRDPVVGADPDALRRITESLRLERERRMDLLKSHRVRDWEELPDTARPPLLLTWITEFDSFLGIVGADRMKEELKMSRAAGMIYLADAQNLSGEDTGPRSQFGTFIAGHQPSRDLVRPNIGLRLEEILEFGGVLPTDLQQRQFTIRKGQTLRTVTVPSLPTEALNAALDQVPKAASIAMAVVAAATPSAGVRSGAYKPPLSDSERRRIIEAAQEEIKAKGDQATRRGAFRRAYPDFSPSGERYAQFGAVLNEEGLLTKASSPSLPSAREMINTA